MTSDDGKPAPAPAADRAEGDERPADRVVRDRRFWADIIDVYALPVLVDLPRVWDQYSGRWLQVALTSSVVALLVAMEAILGRTPGKLWCDLEVRTADGSRVGWRAAALRRSWMLVLPVAAAVDLWVADVVALGVILSVVWTLSRDPAGRGWHDQLADTLVVATERPASRVVKLATAIPLATLVTLVLVLPGL